MIFSQVGIESDLELAKASKLEIDPTHGGFKVNAELEARRVFFLFPPPIFDWLVSCHSAA